MIHFGPRKKRIITKKDILSKNYNELMKREKDIYKKGWTFFRFLAYIAGAVLLFLLLFFIPLVLSFNGVSFAAILFYGLSIGFVVLIIYFVFRLVKGRADAFKAAGHSFTEEFVDPYAYHRYVLGCSEKEISFRRNLRMFFLCVGLIIAVVKFILLCVEQ